MRMLSPDSKWTVRGLIRELLEGVKRQPVALPLALVVAPGVWYAPADVLYDRLIPDPAQPSGSAPLWLHVALLGACTIWSCMLWAGELQIAIDSVRGSRVHWQRFREGVRQTFRLAVTAAPLTLLFGGGMVLPEGDWLDVWALPVLLATLMGAVTLAARTILWAPCVIDGRLSLSSGLSVSWNATRAHTWRIVRLGFVLAIPLAPLFVLETVLFGKSWLAGGLLGGLYTLAGAHLYCCIPGEPKPPASSPTDGAHVVSEVDSAVR